MSAANARALLIGIFVGGRGLRLGGVPKGNLAFESGEQLLPRLLATCRSALPESPLVLIGDATPYTEHGVAALADDPPGIGPLGGLRALLLHAERIGAPAALGLACDLPYLGGALLARLAREAPSALFLGAREGELWHTLAARYATAALPVVDAAIAAGERALQRVVGRLGAGAVELAVSAEERAELRDWDTPEDVRAGRQR